MTFHFFVTPNGRRWHELAKRNLLNCLGQPPKVVRAARENDYTKLHNATNERNATAGRMFSSW